MLTESSILPFKGIYRRAIASILVITFLATNSDLALAQDYFKEKNSAVLQPPSRFKGDDPFVVIDSNGESSHITQAFKDRSKIAFLAYIAARYFSLKMPDEDSLREMVETRLHDKDFASKVEVKKTEGADDEIFCSHAIDGKEVRIRYFLLKDGEEAKGARRMLLSNGRMMAIEVIGEKPEPARTLCQVPDSANIIAEILWKNRPDTIPAGRVFLAIEEGRHYLCIEDRRLIGTVSFEEKESGGQSPDIFISELFVESQYVDAGFETLLLRTVAQKARGRDISKITAEVASGEKDIYVNSGFEAGESAVRGTTEDVISKSFQVLDEKTISLKTFLDRPVNGNNPELALKQEIADTLRDIFLNHFDNPASFARSWIRDLEKLPAKERALPIEPFEKIRDLGTEVDVLLEQLKTANNINQDSLNKLLRRFRAIAIAMKKTLDLMPKGRSGSVQEKRLEGFTGTLKRAYHDLGILHNLIGTVLKDTASGRRLNTEELNTVVLTDSFDVMIQDDLYHITSENVKLKVNFDITAPGGLTINGEMPSLDPADPAQIKTGEPVRVRALISVPGCPPSIFRSNLPPDKFKEKCLLFINFHVIAQIWTDALSNDPDAEKAFKSLDMQCVDFIENGEGSAYVFEGTIKPGAIERKGPIQIKARFLRARSVTGRQRLSNLHHSRYLYTQDPRKHPDTNIYGNGIIEVERPGNIAEERIEFRLSRFVRVFSSILVGLSGIVIMRDFVQQGPLVATTVLLAYAALAVVSYVFAAEIHEDGHKNAAYAELKKLIPTLTHDQFETLMIKDDKRGYCYYINASAMRDMKKACDGKDITKEEKARLARIVVKAGPKVSYISLIFSMVILMPVAAFFFAGLAIPAWLIIIAVSFVPFIIYSFVFTFADYLAIFKKGGGSDSGISGLIGDIGSFVKYMKNRFPRIKMAMQDPRLYVEDAATGEKSIAGFRWPVVFMAAGHMDEDDEVPREVRDQIRNEERVSSIFSEDKGSDQEESEKPGRDDEHYFKQLQLIIERKKALAREGKIGNGNGQKAEAAKMEKNAAPVVPTAPKVKIDEKSKHAKKTGMGRIFAAMFRAACLADDQAEAAEKLVKKFGEKGQRFLVKQKKGKVVLFVRKIEGKNRYVYIVSNPKLYGKTIEVVPYIDGQNRLCARVFVVTKYKDGETKEKYSESYWDKGSNRFIRTFGMWEKLSGVRGKGVSEEDAVSEVRKLGIDPSKERYTWKELLSLIPEEQVPHQVLTILKDRGYILADADKMVSREQVELIAKTGFQMRPGIKEYLTMDIERLGGISQRALSDRINREFHITKSDYRKRSGIRADDVNYVFRPKAVEFVLEGILSEHNQILSDNEATKELGFNSNYIKDKLPQYIGKTAVWAMVDGEKKYLQQGVDAIKAKIAAVDKQGRKGGALSLAEVTEEVKAAIKNADTAKNVTTADVLQAIRELNLSHRDYMDKKPEDPVFVLLNLVYVDKLNTAQKRELVNRVQHIRKGLKSPVRDDGLYTIKRIALLLRTTVSIAEKRFKGLTKRYHPARSPSNAAIGYVKGRHILHAKHRTAGFLELPRWAWIALGIMTGTIVLMLFVLLGAKLVIAIKHAIDNKGANKEVVITHEEIKEVIDILNSVGKPSALNLSRLSDRVTTISGVMSKKRDAPLRAELESALCRFLGYVDIEDVNYRSNMLIYSLGLIGSSEQALNSLKKFAVSGHMNLANLATDAIIEIAGNARGSIKSENIVNCFIDVVALTEAPYSYNRVLRYLVNNHGTESLEKLRNLIFAPQPAAREDGYMDNYKFTAINSAILFIENEQRESRKINNTPDTFTAFQETVMASTNSTRPRFIDLNAGIGTFERFARRFEWGRRSDFVSVDMTNELNTNLALRENLVEIKKKDAPGVVSEPESFDIAILNFGGSWLYKESLEVDIDMAFRLCKVGGGVVLFIRDEPANGLGRAEVMAVLGKAGFDMKTASIFEGNNIPASYPKVTTREEGAGRNGYLVLARKLQAEPRISLIGRLKGIRRTQGASIPSLEDFMLKHLGNSVSRERYRIGIAPMLEESIFRGMSTGIFQLWPAIMPFWGFVILQAVISIIFVIAHIKDNRGPPGVKSWFKRYSVPIIVGILNAFVAPFISQDPIALFGLFIGSHTAVNVGVAVINKIFHTDSGSASIGGGENPLDKIKKAVEGVIGPNALQKVTREQWAALSSSSERLSTKTVGDIFRKNSKIQLGRGQAESIARALKEINGVPVTRTADTKNFGLSPEEAWWDQYWKQASKAGLRTSGDEHSSRVISDFVLANIGDKDDLNVVDIGSGRDPWILQRIYERRPRNRFTALDIIDENDVLVSPPIRYKKARAQDTGFIDKSFDLVISVATWDYLVMDEAAAEFNRILKDGGRGILVFHHPDSREIRCIKMVVRHLRRGLSARDAYRNKDLAAVSRLYDEVLEDIALTQFGVDSLDKYLASTRLGVLVMIAEMKSSLVNRVEIPETSTNEIARKTKYISSQLTAHEKVITNLFKNEEAIQKFFAEKGLAVQITMIRSDASSSPDAYGVVVEKSPTQSLGAKPVTADVGASQQLLSDEVLRNLPVDDQKRIDAAVRFIGHIMKIGDLSVADIDRLKSSPQVFDFEGIPGVEVLKFVQDIKAKGANLRLFGNNWEAEPILFLGQHHPLFQDIKPSHQIVSRVDSEALARRIPAAKGFAKALELAKKIQDALYDDSVELSARIETVSLILEELGTVDAVPLAQMALDRIAILAEQKDDPEKAGVAKLFLAHFVDNIFKSRAMADIFMFNRSIVEGFLDPDHPGNDDIGVVYLLAGSSHLYDQAKQIAEANHISTSRMHAIYVNRTIDAMTPELISEYLQQEGISKYKTLVIVDTGFRGTSAQKLADALNKLPVHPEHLLARLASLSEEPYVYGNMQVAGWNNLLAAVGGLGSQEDVDALTYLVHLLDNSFPAEYRSPTRLVRDGTTGRISPVLLRTELPVSSQVARDSMRRGTERLLGEIISYPNIQHSLWANWIGVEDDVYKNEAGKDIDAETARRVRQMVSSELAKARRQEEVPNLWVKNRQRFGVGGGRDVIRLAIARIVNNVLAMFIEDSDRMIVDVGAGEGYLESIMETRWVMGGRTVPFDLNPTFLSRIRQNGLADNTIEGDVYELSRHVQNADAIVACDSYDTFDDLGRAAKESFVALRPGGRLIIFQTLAAEPSTIFREAKRRGLVYIHLIDAFFKNEEDAGKALTAYFTALIKNDMKPNLESEDYAHYTRLLGKLRININTGIFLPSLTSALRGAGFNILKAGSIEGNVITDRVSRHDTIEGKDGKMSLPHSVNLVQLSHGEMILYKNVPNISAGKIVEHAEIIAVVAEKPSTPSSAAEKSHRSMGEPDHTGGFTNNIFLSALVLLGFVLGTIAIAVIFGHHMSPNALGPPSGAENALSSLSFLGAAVAGSVKITGERQRSSHDKASPAFIKSILKDGAEISAAKMQRLIDIFGYCWEHDGWVSTQDISEYTGERKNYRAMTNKEIFRYFGIDLIDYKKMRSISRRLKKPALLFFARHAQKNRVRRMFKAVEKLGFRVSLLELAEIIGFSKSITKSSSSKIFGNCKNRAEVVAFLNDVNYNRSLKKNDKSCLPKDWLPIRVFDAAQTKKAQDRLTGVIEAFGGRVTSKQLAKALGISTVSVMDNYRKVDLDELNEMRRAQSKIPIIGIVEPRTMAAQDRIIAALELLGGVASDKQINRAVGKSYNNILRHMPMDLINEVRISQGKFPLYIIGQKFLSDEVSTPEKKLLSSLSVEIYKKHRDILSVARENREYFGKRGAEVFEGITIPFAYLSTYKNWKRGEVKTAQEDVLAMTILIRTLTLFEQYARYKELEKDTEPDVNGSEWHTKLIAYLKYAAPRALNITGDPARYPSGDFITNGHIVEGEKEICEKLRQWGMPQEPYFISLFKNLEMATAQLDRNDTIPESSTVTLASLVEQALSRYYKEIEPRDKAEFKAAKAEFHRLALEDRIDALVRVHQVGRAEKLAKSRPTQSLAANMASEERFGRRTAWWLNLLPRIFLIVATPFHEWGHKVGARIHHQEIETKPWYWFTGNVGAVRGPPLLYGMLFNLHVVVLTALIGLVIPDSNLLLTIIKYVALYIAAANTFSIAVELGGAAFKKGDLVEYGFKNTAQYLKDHRDYIVFMVRGAVMWLIVGPVYAFIFPSLFPSWFGEGRNVAALAVVICVLSAVIGFAFDKFITFRKLMHKMNPLDTSLEFGEYNVYWLANAVVVGSLAWGLGFIHEDPTRPGFYATLINQTAMNMFLWYWVDKWIFEYTGKVKVRIASAIRGAIRKTALKIFGPRLPRFNTIDDFGRRYTLPNASDRNGGQVLMHHLVEKEFSACERAIGAMSDLRSTMDKNGAKDRPIIIWQNMTLGGFYPYFTDEVMRSFGVKEITEDELKAMVSGEQKTVSRLDGARYILVRMKVPSKMETDEEIYEKTYLMRRASNILGAPVLMIDHGQLEKTKAQLFVEACERREGRVPVCVNASSNFSFKAANANVAAASPQFILLNPNPAASKDGTVASWFDDKYIWYSRERKIEWTGWVPQQVIIAGQERSAGGAIVEWYGRQIEERLHLSSAKESHRPIGLPPPGQAMTYMAILTLLGGVSVAALSFVGGVPFLTSVLAGAGFTAIVLIMWNFWKQTWREIDAYIDTESRLDALEKIYTTLTLDEKKIFLRPDILPVLMGAKPGYIWMEDDADPMPLVRKLMAVPEGQTLGLILTEHFMFFLPAFIERLKKDRSLLQIDDEQTNEMLDLLVSDAAYEEKKHVVENLMEWLYSVKPPFRHQLYGFICGYPTEDIQYLMRINALPGEEGIRLESPYGFFIYSEGGHESRAMFANWHEALREGYSVFESNPYSAEDFEKAVSPEVARIYRMDLEIQKRAKDGKVKVIIGLEPRKKDDSNVAELDVDVALREFKSYTLFLKEDGELHWFIGGLPAQQPAEGHETIAEELISLLDTDSAAVSKRMSELPADRRSEVQNTAIQILTQRVEALSREKINFIPACEITRGYTGEYTIPELMELRNEFVAERTRAPDQLEYEEEIANVYKFLARRGTEEALLRLKIFWFMALPENFVMVQPASGVDYVPGYLFLYRGLTLRRFRDLDPSKPWLALTEKVTCVSSSTLQNNFIANARFYEGIDVINTGEMKLAIENDPQAKKRQRKVLLIKDVESWIRSYWIDRKDEIQTLPPNDFIEKWAADVDKEFLQAGDYVIVSGRSDNELIRSLLTLGYEEIEYPAGIRDRLIRSEPRADDVELNFYDSASVEWYRTFTVLRKPQSPPAKPAVTLAAFRGADDITVAQGTNVKHQEEVNSELRYLGSIRNIGDIRNETAEAESVNFAGEEIRGRDIKEFDAEIYNLVGPDVSSIAERIGAKYELKRIHKIKGLLKRIALVRSRNGTSGIIYQGRDKYLYDHGGRYGLYFRLGFFRNVYEKCGLPGIERLMEHVAVELYIKNLIEDNYEGNLGDADLAKALKDLGIPEEAIDEIMTDFETTENPRVAHLLTECVESAKIDGTDVARVLAGCIKSDQRILRKIESENVLADRRLSIANAVSEVTAPKEPLPARPIADILVAATPQQAEDRINAKRGPHGKGPVGDLNPIPPEVRRSIEEAASLYSVETTRRMLAATAAVATGAVRNDTALDNMPATPVGNPYEYEEYINRGFGDINAKYADDISRTINNKLMGYHGLPLKILLIGVGRGYEALGLMHTYGNKIEITAVNKTDEDLLYRSAGEVRARFEKDGISITTEEAEDYLNALQSKYLLCDMEERLATKDEYDMVIFCSSVVEHLRKKIPALENALKACKEGGVVYCDLAGTNVMEHDVLMSARQYLGTFNDPRIVVGPSGVKIIKRQQFQLPVFEEVRWNRVQVGRIWDVVDTTYKVINPSPATAPAEPARDEAPQRDPKDKDERDMLGGMSEDARTGVEETRNKLDAAATVLANDDKIRRVAEEHRSSYQRFQRDDMRPEEILTYGMTDTETAKDVIRWLQVHGYLNKGSKFCDPFMGNGLLVDLAVVMTEADATGIEENARIFSDAVTVSQKLADEGIIDRSRVHLIRGDSRDTDLMPYDVFYFNPPWEDGVPHPYLTADAIFKMKPGAVIVMWSPDLASASLRPYHLEKYIEKIPDTGGFSVYRRIVDPSRPGTLPNTGAVQQITKKESPSAMAFAKAVKLAADKPGAQNIVIAIETNGSVPVEQRAPMQSLMKAIDNFAADLNKLLKQAGVNVTVGVVMGDAKTLNANLAKKREEIGKVPDGNVYILGSANTLVKSGNFDLLKGKALLACYDPANVRVDRILDMLTLQIRIGAELGTAKSVKGIAIRWDGNDPNSRIMYLELENPEPFDTNRLKLQIETLGSQA